MLRTTLLLSILTGLLLGVGYAIGGQTGLTVALLLSFVLNLGSYWFSDKIVLSMHKAQEITRNENTKLYDMTNTLSQSAAIPMPKLYLYESPQPNAFATGRNYNHSAVALSTGILELLDERELKGVIAHELAHIKNRDILTSSIAATIGGAISFMGEMVYGIGSLFSSNNDEDRNPVVGIVLAIVAPIVAMIVQFAISRSREFEADKTGALIAHDTKGLSLALAKLHSGRAAHMAEYDENRTANMAAQHMYIANPLQQIGQLFATHPPAEERIKRLAALKL